MEEKRWQLKKCGFCIVPIEIHWRCKDCDAIIHDIYTLRKQKNFGWQNIKVGDQCCVCYTRDNPELQETLLQERVFDLDKFLELTKEKLSSENPENNFL